MYSIAVQRLSVRAYRPLLGEEEVARGFRVVGRGAQRLALSDVNVPMIGHVAAKREYCARMAGRWTQDVVRGLVI